MNLPTTKTNRLETIGEIDAAEIKDDHVFIHGWAASVAGEESPVKGLALRVGGQAVNLSEDGYGKASADIKQVHPSLLGASACRFVIPVPKASLDSLQGQLIEVTPIGENGSEGRILFHVLAPEIPKPSDENLKIVGGGFNVAYEYLGRLADHLELKKDAHVLDIGCGTGRMAYALAHYLDGSARYEGFDVIEKLITWAQETISTRFPNFTFQTVDIANGLYNEGGSLRADTFSFPYEDASFDVIYLTSVFTHMLRSDIKTYLSEIQRVLRPNGRCLATCFLIDEEARQHMHSDHAKLGMQKQEDYWVSELDKPEAAIGFDEDQWSGIVDEAGLSIESFLPGSWSGRPRYFSFQDALILSRK